MPTLHHKIIERFLTKLAESKEVDSDKIEQLRKLLASNAKPKPEDFAAIFSQPAGEGLLK
ncbi:MAG: hypothetical protein ACE15E_23985 [Acidobacteriota bacterium]